MKTFLLSDELSHSLIAVLFQAGLDVYTQNETYLVIDPDEELPDEFRGAQKLVKPTNVMGKWAMSLTAKKLKSGLK